MKMKYKVGLFLISGIFIFSFFTIFVQASFPDIQGHKYQTAIEFIQERKIVAGYPDGYFRPENTINRAELLTIIVGQKYKNLSSKDCFSDVKATEWYAKFVCKGRELGIVVGYPDGAFLPERNVNFVEALIMLQRAHNIPIDTSGSLWFENSVKNASTMNIIPLDIDYFDEKITRGQMAEMMTRILKYEENELNNYLGSKKNFVVTFEDIQNHRNKEYEWQTSVQSQLQIPSDTSMYCYLFDKTKTAIFGGTDTQGYSRLFEADSIEACNKIRDEFYSLNSPTRLPPSVGGQIDITPPTTPTNVVVSAFTSSQIDLRWIPSADNVGVTGYKVAQIGVIGTRSTPAANYSYIGLAANTRYCFVVYAYDAVDNTSQSSTQVCTTTQAAGTSPAPPSSVTPQAQQQTITSIDDSAARDDLAWYLSHSPSAWTQKIPLYNQDVINFVIVTPGVLLQNSSLKVSFDFLPNYRNRIRSVAFTINDINANRNFTYTATQLEDTQIMSVIPVDQTGQFGTANCIGSVSVTIDDGTVKPIPLSYAENVCFNIIKLREPITNYTVFSSSNLFLIIPKKYEQYGSKFISVANNCSQKVSQLYDQSFNSPLKSIVVIENDDLFYDIAGFGNFLMGKSNIEAVAKMDTCNDVVIPHELTHILVANTPIPAWANEGLATYSQMTVRNDQSIVCGDNSYFSSETGTNTPYANLQQFGTSGRIEYNTPYCFWKLVEKNYGSQAIKAIVKKLMDARTAGTIGPVCNQNWSTFLQEAVLPYTTQQFLQTVKDTFGLVNETTGGRC